MLMAKRCFIAPLRSGEVFAVPLGGHSYSGFLFGSLIGILAGNSCLAFLCGIVEPLPSS